MVSTAGITWDYRGRTNYDLENRNDRKHRKRQIYRKVAELNLPEKMKMREKWRKQKIMQRMKIKRKSFEL